MSKKLTTTLTSNLSLKKINKKDYFVFFSYLDFKNVKYSILEDNTVIVENSLIIDNSIIDNNDYNSFIFKSYREDKLSQNEIKIRVSDYDCLLYYYMKFPDKLIINGDLLITNLINETNSETIDEANDLIILDKVEFGKDLTINGDFVADVVRIELEESEKITIKNVSFKLFNFDWCEENYVKYVELDYYYNSTNNNKQININNNNFEDKIITILPIIPQTSTHQPTQKKIIKDSYKFKNELNIHLIAFNFSKYKYIDLKDNYNKITKLDSKKLDLEDLVVLNTLNYMSTNVLYSKLLMIDYDSEINEDDRDFFLKNKNQLEENKEYNLDNIIFYCRNERAFKFLSNNNYLFNEEELNNIPDDLNHIKNIYEKYLIKNLSVKL